MDRKSRTGCCCGVGKTRENNFLKDPVELGKEQNEIL
jgi:hypothetical protein